MAIIKAKLAPTLRRDVSMAGFVYEDAKDLSSGSLAFGSKLNDALPQARQDGFKGKTGDLAVIHSSGSSKQRYIFIGVGKKKKADLDVLRRSVSALVRRAEALHIHTVALRPFSSLSLQTQRTHHQTYRALRQRYYF